MVARIKILKEKKQNIQTFNFNEKFVLSLHYEIL